MKPPITYFGGKVTLAPQIAALLPPHSHYVEPYCGSLAVLLAKTPAAHETVNDLDRDLMTFWQVVRDQRAAFEEACALTPHSAAEHAESYHLEEGLTDLERARRVWVQLTQGRGGVRSTTGWRHYEKPCGSTAMPDYQRGYVTRLGPAAERLMSVSLECRPALEVIESYGQHSEVLLFVDPTYLGSTRKSGGYVHEMKDEPRHRELAKALHDCEASVVLCGYPSDLHDLDLYAGWNRYTFDASTGQGGTWANRTEVLWSNRRLGHQLDLFDLDGVA